MKNYTKKSLKASNGITLIALVITIIVLLILAGISISMLAGDNSILQKSTEAKRTTERAEAKEQAQMDIMAYIADKTANHQDASLDDTKVKGILTGKSYVKTANATSFITAKGEYEIPYSELYTATNKTPTNPVTSAINYGSKTSETVELGDDITIGTEKFKVLKNENGTIMAMPYYNLVLNSNPIIQATAENASTAGVCSFSTEKYWTTGEDNIIMEDSRNNIQQYINAYQGTLENLGATNVTVRAGKKSELSSYQDYNGPLNPGHIGYYWLGSDYGNEYRAYVSWVAGIRYY